MNFSSKPPPKDILREQVRDALGIVKTRAILFPAVIIFFGLIKLIAPLPVSNLAFLILIGYHSGISLLFLYLFKRLKDSQKATIALDIGQGLFLIEIVLNLFVIYYLSPAFIYLFGSSLWLAFFFYLFYAVAEIGPGGYSYRRGFINLCFILSFLCSAIVFFWEYAGINPSYQFLPGFLYQKPVSSLILFLLLMVVFTGAGSFNSEVWKKFREVNQKLKKLTGELEERVEERTKELEEAKATLEIKVVARTKELKELAESLEEKVRQRTKELQEKVDQLEKFQKLTIGRELKMVALKKEIERLKKELGKQKQRLI